MSDEEDKKSVKFDGTIHLGHVLVFIGMVGSVVSLYATFVSQNERTNYRLDSLEKIITEQGAYNKTVLDILSRLQIGQAITADRLNRLERTPPKGSQNGIPSPFPQKEDLNDRI